jgi:uncharacterized RDD family membrane protein YckC
MEQAELHNVQSAGLLRRLMASLYDWLLILAIMMVASVPLVATDNEAITPGNPVYRLALVAIAATFFAGFWSRNGQTLGMRAWRLKLETHEGANVSFGQGLLRFACACISAGAFGLGYLWVTISRDGCSWHDRWSGTRIRLLPKNKTGPK